MGKSLKSIHSRWVTVRVTFHEPVYVLLWRHCFGWSSFSPVQLSVRVSFVTFCMNWIHCQRSDGHLLVRNCYSNWSFGQRISPPYCYWSNHYHYCAPSRSAACVPRGRNQINTALTLGAFEAADLLTWFTLKLSVIISSKTMWVMQFGLVASVHVVTLRQCVSVKRSTIHFIDFSTALNRNASHPPRYCDYLHAIHAECLFTIVNF